jgi:probable addiction module antidote protein
MAKQTRDHQEWLIEKLSDPVKAASYLNAAYEDSREMFLEALRDVAKVHQMSKVAKDADITRESLYKVTSVTGNPNLDTFISILHALRLRFTIEADIALDTSVPGVPSSTSHGATPTPTAIPVNTFSQEFYRPEALTPPTLQERVNSCDVPPVYVIAESQKEYAIH